LVWVQNDVIHSQLLESICQVLSTSSKRMINAFLWGWILTQQFYLTCLHSMKRIWIGERKLLLISKATQWSHLVVVAIDFARGSGSKHGMSSFGLQNQNLLQSLHLFPGPRGMASSSKTSEVPKFTANWLEIFPEATNFNADRAEDPRIKYHESWCVMATCSRSQHRSQTSL